MATIDKYNLHKATSKIELSYYVAPEPAAGRYQETWIDRNVSQQTTQTGRMVPTEHWKGGWDTSTNKLVAVPQIGGITLACNRTPDAPRHTLVYGKAALPAEGTALSNIYVAHESLRPSSYVDNPEGGQVIPAEDDTTAWNTAPQEFFPDISGAGMKANKNLSEGAIREKFFLDTPFIPSSLGHISKQGNARDKYKGYLKKIEGLESLDNGGILVWNVWDLVSPTQAEDGRVYRKNFGPIWNQQGYSGPTLSQDYAEGVLRVKVHANQTHATVARKAPIEKDIGRDYRFPWIFPYIDNEKQINHLIMKSVGPSDPGDSPNGEAPERAMNHNSVSSEDLANQGFVMNLDITTESERGNAMGQGGASPSVTISWGSSAKPNKDNEAYDWISGAAVQLIPHKQPHLFYQDVNGTQNVILSTSEIPDARITLRVQYIGNHMLVVLNENMAEAKLIRGQFQQGVNESMGPKGVWVTDGSISMEVVNCTVAFDFQPHYYNPWDPSQVVATGWKGDSELGSDPNFHSVSGDPSSLTEAFKRGMVKLPDLCNFQFNINGRDGGSIEGNASTVYQKFIGPFTREATTNDSWRDIETQFVHPSLYNEWIQGNGLAKANLSSYWGGKDFDHPMMILDWRHLVLGASGGATRGSIPKAMPIVPLGYINSTPRQVQATSDPHDDDDQTGDITILLRHNSTHTSPTIKGFKLPETTLASWPDEVTANSVQNAPSQPGTSSLQSLASGSGSSNSSSTGNKAVAEDITQYVSSWTINWKEDGRVMMAEASLELVNPPTWMIRAMEKNILKIRIHSTGYQLNSTHADFLPRIKQALYSADPVFEGFTTEVSEAQSAGGKLIFTVKCQDPMGILMYTLTGSNFRMDGVSSLLAFCSLMRSTDFASRFAVIPYSGYDESKGSPYYRWLGENQTTAEWLENIKKENLGLASMYGMISFGYEPVSAKSHEVSIGSPIYQELKTLLTCMDDPGVQPVFYYDPRKARFTLAFRQNVNSITRLSVSSVPQDLNSALPLISSEGGEGGSFYTKVSQTENIISHYTLVGTSRLDNSPIKRTVTNPNWNVMRGRGIREAGQGIMGHVGFVRKSFDPHTEQMFADQRNLLREARYRMWYKMRPSWTFNDMKVLGLVMPNSDDATVCVLIEGKMYWMTFLNGSQIHWDQKEGTLVSSFNVSVWPQFDADLNTLNEQFGGR